MLQELSEGGHFRSYLWPKSRPLLTKPSTRLGFEHVAHWSVAPWPTSSGRPGLEEHIHRLDGGVHLREDGLELFGASDKGLSFCLKGSQQNNLQCTLKELNLKRSEKSHKLCTLKGLKYLKRLKGLKGSPMSSETSCCSSSRSWPAGSA